MVDERNENTDVEAAALGVFEPVVLELDVLELIVPEFVMLKFGVLELDVLELDVPELGVLKLVELELNVALKLVLELGVLDLVALRSEACAAVESVVAIETIPMLEEGLRLDNPDADDEVNSVRLFEVEFVDDELGGLADKAVTVVDDINGRVVVAIEMEEEGLDVKLEELLSVRNDIEPDTVEEVEIVLLDA